MMMGENSAAPGDMILADYDGQANGRVEVILVDPMKLTGDDYAVTFDEVFPDGTEAINWTLTNTTTGEVLEANNPNVGGQDQLTGLNVGVGASPIHDGFQVNVYGLPEVVELIAVEEYASGYAENRVLRDNSVSYLPPSLGRTGYLIENRAGSVNNPPYANDFDRFSYWETDDVELDFGQTSLAWSLSLIHI